MQNKQLLTKSHVALEDNPYGCLCSVLAAKNLGLDEYNSFLDHTYLGDRTTTIRQYLESGLGVGVMEELPPIALQERYGG